MREKGMLRPPGDYKLAEYLIYEHAKGEKAEKKV